jgi:hypothetical protein
MLDDAYTWILQQPLGFGVFGAAVVLLVVIAYRGMRGPEV